MPKTAFRTETDGFAFPNNWKFDDFERKTIHDIVLGAATQAAVNLGPIYAPALGLVVGAVSETDILVSLLSGGLVPLGSVATVATAASIAAAASGKLCPIFNGWIDSVAGDYYGLCGGMAYAALDYYRLGWVIPRGMPGKVPERDTPEGTLLRNYIWQRLIDTFLTGNAAIGTLEWMGLLHIIPSNFGGGGPELLNRTKGEWTKLKLLIDSEGPWPIALVGTTKSPMHNHQILAYGYEDAGDGTGLIYVYDNTAPDQEHTISCNFRQQELIGTESNPNPARGPLKGFFCTNYIPNNAPPIAVGLNAGLTLSPQGAVAAGESVSFHFEASNVAYGDSPGLKLDVIGVSLAGQGKIDGGEQGIGLPLHTHNGRDWSGSITMSGKPGGWRFFAACHLPTGEWKNIPAMDTGTTPYADLSVYASQLQGLWDIDANGFAGQLNIQAIDPKGNISGTLFGNPIIGFWDEESKALTFERITNPADVQTFQFYTGYLFLLQGGGFNFMMAGSFDAFAGSGATAQRVEYGWYAKQPVIG